MNKTKLIQEMVAFIQYYGHTATEEAVGKILDTWETNKASLINLLRKHPYWNEEALAVVFDSDYIREKNEAGARYALEKMYHVAYDFAVQDKAGILRNGIDIMYRNYSQYIESDDMERLRRMENPWQIKIGTKRSRAMGAMIKAAGVEEVEEYRRWFSDYSDCVNPMQIRRHTIASLHPMDYLTMAFGNNWSVCTTPDKRNKRNTKKMSRGDHCSGLLSYLMDSSTLIFYTLPFEYEGGVYWSQDKVFRALYHYKDGLLIQNRLYPDPPSSQQPQQIREIMQKIIMDCYGEANLWKLKRASSNVLSYVKTIGTHYPDYKRDMGEYSGKEYEVSVSVSKMIPTEGVVVEVGHEVYCPNCGTIHELHKFLNCIDCVPKGLLHDFDYDLWNRIYGHREEETLDDDEQDEDDDFDLLLVAQLTSP